MFVRPLKILLLGMVVCAAVFDLTSCGPVYTGLEGLGHMMPEDKTVKCPFCKKQISESDRRCPFCGRDVQFDQGSDQLDQENNRMYRDRDASRS